MSRFLNLERPDPYRLFAAVLRRSRLGIKAAYDAAFAANVRCNELMDEERLLSARSQPFAFPMFGDDIGYDPYAAADVAERRAELWAEAQAEDLQAEFQASIVVYWADDSLRRFERSALNRTPTFAEGYGPTYGQSVSLTTLLRAGTNTSRHVSEWDDDHNLRFPYDPTMASTAAAKQAYRNIETLQRAFGIGKDGPIREPVCWRILVAVDGLLGTQEPDYARFEAPVIKAAREIAQRTGGDALTQLDTELARR